MKKITILIVSALLCSAMALSACGAKNQFSAPVIEEDSVAEVTLYGFNGDSERVFALINLGHAFITVKNVSSSPLNIGAFTLTQNEEVSIGTWGMNAHWGIWYNVESTYMTLNRYDGRGSVTMGIDSSDIQKMSAYLAANDTWTPFKNCSYFAVDLWNLVADSGETFDFSGLITPGKVLDRIQNTKGYQTNRSPQTFSKVGYCADYNKIDAAAADNWDLFNEFNLRDIKE